MNGDVHAKRPTRDTSIRFAVHPAGQLRDTTTRDYTVSLPDVQTAIASFLREAQNNINNDQAKSNILSSRGTMMLDVARAIASLMHGKGCGKAG
ncbi:MAG: hypothetical protein IGS48_16410 [Oscillatoriales cyanobacterium C42_A2020_001]|nr:hypothetical protein [Leptolyngbyaceae cyanobacterium C42_A2020_001]